MAERWIEIVNWPEFQHYTDRDPIWIKNYTALLDNEDYLNLPPATRGLLHELWLLYATSHGRVRHSTRTLSRRLRHRVFTEQLEALRKAGFIRVRASKPLALTRSREKYLRTSKKPLARSPKKSGELAAKNKTNSGPPRDPEAVAKLREIADKIGRQP